jgi:hypothetical protein
MLSAKGETAGEAEEENSRLSEKERDKLRCFCLTFGRTNGRFQYSALG